MWKWYQAECSDISPCNSIAKEFVIIIRLVHTAVNPLYSRHWNCCWAKKSHHMFHMSRLYKSTVRLNSSSLHKSHVPIISSQKPGIVPRFLKQIEYLFKVISSEPNITLKFFIYLSTRKLYIRNQLFWYRRVASTYLLLLCYLIWKSTPLESEISLYNAILPILYVTCDCC